MNLEESINITKLNFKREERKNDENEVLDNFGTLFSPQNIDNLTKTQFKSFLTIKNNKHWDGIHRNSNNITKDMEKLKNALKILLDETKDIAERLDILIPKKGPKYVKYLGGAILTPILHVVYPNKYGVYNSITKQALEKLNLKPILPRGAGFSEEYVKVNQILNDLSKEHDISLFQLDEVWWNVLDRHNPNEIFGLGFILKEICRENGKLFEKQVKTVSGDDEIYDLLKNGLPITLKRIIENSSFKTENYEFVGSSGQGNRARCPWTAILDKRITETVQEGYYPVYLFQEDGNGVYLSLNQGTTDIKNQYQNKFKDELKKRADGYRNIIDSHQKPINEKIVSKIDLSLNNDTCKAYELGNVYAFHYELDNIPDDETLETDLKTILEYYEILTSQKGKGWNSDYNSFYDFLVEKGYYFNKETIENYLLSLKIKPFVILTGNSGTGKTKLAQLFAQYKSKPENNNNSIQTDVKVGKSLSSKGWALKREDVSKIIPTDEFEDKFDIVVDGIPATGELNISPRIFFRKGNANLKAHLEELSLKDPEKRINLEIKLPESESNQYKIVPVGANWTENRHILGFHNVITNDYQKTSSLDLILNAKKPEHNNLPHFLILDEMNLSHVERYFADFLSSLESGESIPLHMAKDLENNANDNGIPEELELSDNLLVIGTVNVDETTYMFSPKVLDRANTIEFATYSAKNYMMDDFEGNAPDGDLDYLENPLQDSEIRKYDINQLRELLENVETSNGANLWIELSHELESFQKILKKAGFDFGFRVINEILRFMCVAWRYEKEPDIWDNWERYFDAQIKQKMLPKLHGSERVLGDVLLELYNLCLDADEKIKYKTSAQKLEEMQKVLYEQRYVSFIN